MTCIAVRIEKDQIVIAWDTEITYKRAWAKLSTSWDKLYKDHTKIEKVNNMVFGVAWYLEDSLHLKQYCKLHNPKWSRLDDMEDYILWFYDYCKKKDSNFEPFSSMIIIYDKKVFHISGYMIHEVGEYYAIGSGMFHAITALYLWKSAKQSVEIACELAMWVWWNIEEEKIDL